MRAFIAIDLPEAIQVALDEQQAAFCKACSSRRGGEIRWARPEGIHLTLKFLGEISDEQIRRVSEALTKLEPFHKFSIEVRGFGFFPDARRPRVFWAGVAAAPELGVLAKRVEASMEKLGFAPEGRIFSPHLTLARLRIPRPQPALQALIEREGEKSLGRFEVSEFFLFESKLLPQGAEYRKVTRFPVQEAGAGASEMTEGTIDFPKSFT